MKIRSSKSEASDFHVHIGYRNREKSFLFSRTTSRIYVSL